MPTHLEWPDIAIRLPSTIIASALIGLDRGEHGRPAGLRTTMLVSMAACVAMIQVNLLLPLAGKPTTSFVVLDLMRLPLGILSGMGFIGAGAIVRRDNFVVGVTTAATMWFVTVVGLCFGGGQIALGVAGSAIGMVILEGLKPLELRIKQDRRGTFLIVVDPSGPSEVDICESLKLSGLKLLSCAFAYIPERQTTELTCDLRWKAVKYESKIPEAIHALARRPGVVKVAWTPQVK